MISYSVREGLAGFRRARFSSVASTSAMAVALILIGLFAIVSFQARNVTIWLKQHVGELELFLVDSDEAVAKALFTRAETVPGISEARYISREEAEEIFRSEFGEEADVFFDQQFLPASIKVRVEADYANADSLGKLASEFESWNRVDEVVFNQPLLLKMQRNLRLITTLGLVLGFLVVLASAFLVANTIRLSIYARRLLIRTMKLVGATDAFVRRPFVVEGVLQGIIAGVIASAALSLLYLLIQRFVPQMAAVPIWEGALFGGIEILVGVGLGWLASHFAVRRFIRNVSLH
jgi:cell division transport system permease protein